MPETKRFLKGKMKDNSPWFIPLDKREILIGRGPDSDLILQAPSVSRKHGLIRIFGDAVYIKDAGSRNGTFVNGVRISEERELRPRDIIKLGALEFTFMEELDDEESEKTQIDMGKVQEKDFIKEYGLSAREEEVFYLLLKGLKVRDISERLFISNGTAKNHVLRIYGKTGCHSRIELSSKYQDYIS